MKTVLCNMSGLFKLSLKEKIILKNIKLSNTCKGHFISSGAPMDGKVSDGDKNLVCYVYKYKKLLF